MTRAATLIIVAALAVAAAAQRPTPAATDALGAVAGGFALAGSPAPPASRPDPFPLRRVLVSAADLADRLKVLPPGPVVRLDRDDFEARVRAATPRASVLPPQLLEARYTARHSADGLRGMLTWKFEPGTPQYAFADALKVALLPDAAGRVSGTPRGGPAVRLSDSGEVALEWSARGNADGDAERFDLGLPAAPMATLDLDLPADREPSLGVGPPGRWLSGPLPGAAPGRQSRRVLFPGVGRVELVLRPTASPGERGAAVKVSRVSRYEIERGVVTLAIDFTLQATRGAPNALDFVVDPLVTVTEVAGAETWSVAGTPPRLRVGCPGGLPATLTVRGFVAPPAAAESGWRLPDVTLVNGLVGDDRVEVTCRPDLQWLGCDPGDYRSQPAAVPPAPDGGVRFGFRAVPRDGPPTPGESRKLPRVRVRAAGPAFTADDDVTWDAGTPTSESRLTARFRVAVSRGPLEALNLECDPGYSVMSAEQVGEDAPLAVGGRRVELARPVGSGESAEVVVTLAGPRSRPGAAVSLPSAACGGATGREGTYTVAVPVGYEAATTARPAAKSANPTRLRFPLRGRAPNATLTLTPHAPRLTGTSDTTVTVVDGVPCRETAFRVAAAGGPLGEVRLRVPRGSGACVRPESLAARVSAVSPVEPWLPALGAANPLAGLALAAAASTGDATTEVQRVTFPSAELTEVVVRVRAFADAAGNFPAALPAVLNATTVPTAPPPPAPPEPGPPTWAFRDLLRAVAVDANGGVTATVSGVLVSGGTSEWRGELPPGATLLGATAYGKAADSVRLTGGAAVLPAPVGGVGSPEMPFEVRFRAAAPVPWAGGGVTAPAVSLPGDPPLPTAWDVHPAYRTWPRLEPLAARPPRDEPPTLVLFALPLAVGWSAAAGLLGGAFVLASRRRLPAGVAVAVGVVALAVWAALPEGWALALRPVALASALLATVTLLATPRPRGGVLAVAVGLLSAAQAADSEKPQTVLVVAGPGERWTVYAAQPTLDELATLSRPLAPGLTVVGVEYDGRCGATGDAEFRATVTLDSSADGESVYELLLDGARLESVTLDGLPALAEATRLDAYAVRVRGRGRHTLVASFRVATVVADGGRETRFTGPDFPATRLTFRSPAANVAVPSRRGAQSVARRGDETVCVADHGGGRAVVVRAWDAPAPATPLASVREGHLWDIGEADATLSSAFQCTVSSGSLSGVALEVPADLEPGTPTVRAAGGPGVRAVTLTPAGAGRRMAIEFATPLAGKFTVVVPFTPRSLLVTRPTLALPRSLDTAAVETLAGLRVRGLALEALDKRGLIDFPADDLARRFGAPAEWQLDRQPADRVMQRLPGATAELRPTLRVKSDAGVVACETRWSLGPAVEVEAQVALTRFAPTDCVEIDWPEGVTLREVRSPELHGWSKSGSRVQVWFRAPTRQAVVTLVGRSPAAPPAVGIAADLGAVRATGGGPCVLRVRPTSGTVAQFVPAKGVALRPDSSPAETLLTLDAGVSAGRVAIELAPPPDTPRPKSPARPAPQPSPTPNAPPEAVAIDPPPSDDWAAARAWLVPLWQPLALVGIALARRRGLRTPECLAACGLLGGALAGPTTFLGIVFLAAGAVGVAWRLARLAARAARLVLR